LRSALRNSAASGTIRGLVTPQVSGEGVRNSSELHRRRQLGYRRLRRTANLLALLRKVRNNRM
jgi:hypothetical protein